jgi:hypothetical protein
MSLFINHLLALRGPTFSCRATDPPFAKWRARALLRFVFKNRNHNVPFYQSPTRFEGAHFLMPSDRSPLRQVASTGSSPLCFSKTETTTSFVINYLLALRGAPFSWRDGKPLCCSFFGPDPHPQIPASSVSGNRLFRRLRRAATHRFCVGAKCKGVVSTGPRLEPLAARSHSSPLCQSVPIVSTIFLQTSKPTDLARDPKNYPSSVRRIKHFK